MTTPVDTALTTTSRKAVDGSLSVARLPSTRDDALPLTPAVQAALERLCKGELEALQGGEGPSRTEADPVLELLEARLDALRRRQTLTADDAAEVEVATFQHHPAHLTSGLPIA